MASHPQWADESLTYLNDRVYNNIPRFKQILYNDYSNIMRIINLYKQNPQFIKTKQINDFGLKCQQNSRLLLAVYENEFFKPAYNKYRQMDQSLTYEYWIDSVALSERSLFYDFYELTQANLRDCTKIVERSTNR